MAIGSMGAPPLTRNVGLSEALVASGAAGIEPVSVSVNMGMSTARPLDMMVGWPKWAASTGSMSSR